MKPGKVLCCAFLSAILWVGAAKNRQNRKGGLSVLMQLTNSSIVIMHCMHGQYMDIKQ